MDNFQYRDDVAPQPPQKFAHPHFEDAVRIQLLSIEGTDLMFEVIVLAHGDSFLVITILGYALESPKLSEELDNLLLNIQPNGSD